MYRAKSKYRAVRTEVDGHVFASKKEAKRYGELKLLERAGEITGLRLQPSYELKVNGDLICRYVADFQYYECYEWHKVDGHHVLVVEDVKGVKTPAYRIKRKLMKAIHGIEVRET